MRTAKFSCDTLFGTLGRPIDNSRTHFPKASSALDLILSHLLQIQPDDGDDFFGRMMKWCLIKIAALSLLETGHNGK